MNEDLKADVAELHGERADERQQEHDQAPLRACRVDVQPLGHEGEDCNEALRSNQERHNRTMLTVIAADSVKRTTPTRRPSFLRLSLKVMKDCSQQNTVPTPKASLVPAWYVGRDCTWKLPTSVIPKQAMENVARLAMFSQGLHSLGFSWRVTQRIIADWTRISSSYGT
ncbi:hypothetical protein CRUP_030780 [Coryphaenoides rupestris]|nr:hypothetical protein CRUP_030780 [Coryphaenoides rupestris]